MNIPERDPTDNGNVTRSVIKSSLPDSATGSIRELGALFDQSPIALVFVDRELRVKRTNAAFRRLVGMPGEVLIGRRPSEVGAGMDTAMIERTLAEQVMKRGVPVVDVHLEQTVAGQRRDLSWSAYRVTENGQVLGVMGALIDVTDRAQAVRSLRRAHARLDLLERAASQIGTTLDIHRTAGELADLAVPELADRVVVDLVDQVLQGENPPRTNSGTLRLRRVVVRDAASTATVNFEVGDLITAPVTGSAASAVWQGKPVLARNPAEMTGQVAYTPSHAEALLARGLHTLMAVPLTARGVTLGVVLLGRAERPEPYDEADVRLVSDLVSRAAVHIDNARLYTREHNTAVTLQRSLLPRDIPQVAGLQIAYRYQPLARLGRPPEEIMCQLSDVVAGHGDEIGATCLYAVYDPASRRCRLTSAGHPPPAMRHPGGTVEFIDVPGGVMLGVGHSRYPAADIQLPAGGVLALYTDGLVEQPGQDIGTGMSQLARTLTASTPRSLDDLCDSVLTALGHHARDDIALLLARTTAEAAR